MNLLDSIEQTSAHNKTSNKYKFVSTKDILNRLAMHGWNVRQQTQVRPRNESNKGFQKHLVRLSNENFTYNDFKIEVLLTNSHAGDSSVRLNLGIYRFVCANGLVVGKSFFERRVLHKGFTHDKLDKALNDLLTQAPEVNKRIIQMKNLQLSSSQIVDLAKSFSAKRLDSIKHVSEVKHARMLSLYRVEDNKRDLFTVYNILQEKIIRGGIKYTTSTPVFDINKTTNAPMIIDYKVKNHTTRAIKNIDSDLNLNAFMFDKACELLAA